MSGLTKNQIAVLSKLPDDWEPFWLLRTAHPIYGFTPWTRTFGNLSRKGLAETKSEGEQRFGRRTERGKLLLELATPPRDRRGVDGRDTPGHDGESAP